jgi:hypothetical protein
MDDWMDRRKRKRERESGRVYVRFLGEMRRERILLLFSLFSLLATHETRDREKERGVYFYLL